MRTKKQQDVLNVVESIPFMALTSTEKAAYFMLGAYADENGFMDAPSILYRQFGIETQAAYAALVNAGLITRNGLGYYVAGYHKSGKQAAQEKAQADALFDELWREYPRKEGKAAVKTKRRLEIAKVGKERMLAALDAYKRKIIGKDREYVMMGSTFFNGRYEDYLEQEQSLPFTDAPAGDYEEPAY